MHPFIFRQYKSIFENKDIDGAVLEIGAIPTQHSLLNLPAFSKAKEKVGINLDGPYDCGHYYIVKGNANDMNVFDSDHFDIVICNAVIEHDPYFWKTLSEIKRVTKPGGMIVVGAPGYRKLKNENLIGKIFNRIPILRKLKHHPIFNLFFTTTLTVHVHSAPGDYYRFSEEFFEKVAMEGLLNVQVKSNMVPPRIMAYGFMPQ